ncbi:hypothetical protein J7E83_20745 [Arthrobacter sp. ISL-48]|uniref:hypothetical protein n=1 Tax=Arthrobacter sp. ISL-48 TaxID=2819110 RepID=UPI001BE95393|nr:hypothetical protein [Arthrobacter sp. ISL-48]MBT2534511.1 hypothetical protein [Arthrobacter sp. ISL-48]
MRGSEFAGRASREQQADSIKEGIYLTFAALAVSLAVAVHGDVEAASALATLLVSAAGMVLAIFVADIVSHLVVHDLLMTRAGRRHSFRSAFGALATIVLPTALLAAAAMGWWPADTAVWAAVAALAATLLVITALAIKGTALPWWQRIALVGSLAALSLAVIGVQTIAHSH